MGILEEEERQQNAAREAAQAAAAATLAAAEAAKEQAEIERMTWTAEGRELADEFLRKARERNIAPSETLHTVTVKRTTGYSEQEMSRVPFASAYVVGHGHSRYLICAETGSLLEEAPAEVISEKPTWKSTWFRDRGETTTIVVKSWRRIPLTNIVVHGSTDYNGDYSAGHTLVQVMATFLNVST